MQVDLFDAGRSQGWHKYSGTADQIERSLRKDYHWHGRRVRQGDLRGLLARLRGGRLLSVCDGQEGQRANAAPLEPTFIHVAEVLLAYPNPCLQEGCTTCSMRRWIEDAGRHVFDLQTEVASLDLQLLREVPSGWSVLAALLHRHKARLDLPSIGRAWALQRLDSDFSRKARDLLGLVPEVQAGPRRRLVSMKPSPEAASPGAHFLSRTGKKLRFPSAGRMQPIGGGLFGAPGNGGRYLLQGDLPRLWRQAIPCRLAGTWGHTELSEAVYWVEVDEKSRVFFRLPFQRNAIDLANSAEAIAAFFDAYRAFRCSRGFRKVNRLEAICSFGPGEIRLKVGRDPGWRYLPLTIGSGSPFPSVGDYSEAPVTGASLIQLWTR